MTPSCRNCHGSPAAKAPEPSELRLSNDAPLRPSLVKDPAGDNWSEWLKAPVPQLQDLEWWTRSNFEKALRDRRRAEGQPSLPFRIFVKDAELEAHLYPKALPIEINWFPDAKIIPSANGEIHSKLSIRDNQIPLLMRSLIDFTGIRVGLTDPLLLETAPQQISVGNYGDLHLIIGPKTGARGIMDFLTPMMTPTMPIGYDFPHGDENMNPACSNPEAEAEAKRLDCPPISDWIYQNRSDPRRDLVLTSQVPQELLSPQDRLPKAYGVEDLILRVLRLVQRSKSAKPPSAPEEAAKPSFLENLLTYLKPGSRVTLSLRELEDFFLPGVLDLGPSEGKVELTVGGSGELLIDVSEFSLNVDAMDYPNRKTWEAPAPDVCQPNPHVVLERPTTRVHYATVYPGMERTNSAGEVQKPGIHAVYYPGAKQLSLKANLHVTGDFTLPVGGHVDASGDALVETEIAFTEDGIKVIPRTTTVELKDWNLFRVRDSDAPGSTSETGDNLVAQQLEFLLTDNFRRKGFVETPSFVQDPEFEFHASALLPWEKVRVSAGATQPSKKQERLMRHLEIEGTLRAPQDETGLYDLAALTTAAEANAQIKIRQGGEYGKSLEEYTAALALTPSPSAGPLATFRGEGIDYLLRADVEKSSLGTKGMETQSLLHGLVLAVQQEKLECVSQWNIKAKADQIQVPLKSNQIQLNGLFAEIKLDRVQLTQDNVALAIPVLDLAVNSQGSSTGPLQGEISLAQSREEKLLISYNRGNDELLIQGLNILFRAQELHLFDSKAIAMLDPRVRGLGLDGHLLGHFQMSFPEPKENWHGSGLIQVRGDSNGDIFFQDAKGRQVGPPLLRNSQWNFRNIRSIDWQNGYLLGKEGDFSFSFILNLAALNLFSQEGGSPPAAPDPEQGGLGPFEMAIASKYNNQPINAAGFKNWIRKYISQEYHLASPEGEFAGEGEESTEGGTP